MKNPSEQEIHQALHELVGSERSPAWLVDMIEHYWKTGIFRPEDLRRFTGDPSEGVRVKPNASVDALLAASNPAPHS